MSQIVRIDCPICRGTLEVNLESGKVVRHWTAKPEKAPPADLAALAEQVRRRGQQGLPDVARVLEDQQRRRDEDFERARRKAIEDSPPAAPPAPE